MPLGELLTLAFQGTTVGSMTPFRFKEGNSPELAEPIVVVIEEIKSTATLQVFPAKETKAPALELSWTERVNVPPAPETVKVPTPVSQAPATGSEIQ